jgi:hypothetical protein
MSYIFENDVKCPLIRVAVPPLWFSKLLAHTHVLQQVITESKWGEIFIHCNFVAQSFHCWNSFEYSSTCHCYLGCGILLLLDYIYTHVLSATQRVAEVKTLNAKMFVFLWVMLPKIILYYPSTFTSSTSRCVGMHISQDLLFRVSKVFLIYQSLVQIVSRFGHFCPWGPL